MSDEDHARSGDTGREPRQAEETPGIAAPPRPSSLKEGLRLLRDLLVAVGVVGLVGYFVASPFRVEGSSMVPALESGDRLLVEKLSLRFGTPGRGTIVVLRSPEGPVLVKRVVGLPGDLPEPLGSGSGAPLGPDEYWVVGDNAEHSRDSRHFGPVDAEALVGRAVWRYWPPSAMGGLER